MHIVEWQYIVFEFLLKFQIFFPKVKLKIIQADSVMVQVMNVLALNRRQVITWINIDQNSCHYGVIRHVNP